MSKDKPEVGDIVQETVKRGQYIRYFVLERFMGANKYYYMLLVPRTMKNGKIVEVYTKFNGKLGYEPLDTMNTCNIIAGDWEIVNKKAQDNVKKSHNAEENKPKSEKNLTIQVEKEVYEAVLRNSVKVADLEAENYKLKSLLHSCRNILEDEGWHLTVKQIDEVLK